MYVCYLTIYLGTKMPKFYIGSTSRKNLDNGYKGSVVSKRYKDIWKSELKNSPELFNTLELYNCDTREEAMQIELSMHKQFDVVKSEYFINQSYASINGMFGRDVKGQNNPMYGRTHSDETKEKLRIARGHLKRYEMTDEIREIVSRTHKGKIVSDETKAKLSKALTGRKGTFTGRTHSDETKKKISEANTGNIHSAETRKKISDANKGRITSDETKAKISKIKMGVKRGPTSDETKAKLSKALKGRIRSAEHCKNLSKPRRSTTRTCPHCGKTGAGGNMARYHFDNCKHKK